MDTPVIKINRQIWMIKNLDVDYFRNGDLVPTARSNEDWVKASELKRPACCLINDPVNGRRFGKFYNWYAIADPRGLAPNGWHIPSKNEFEVLQKSVNNSRDALLSFKQLSGDNKSGFYALLAGIRYGQNGYFGYAGHDTAFWSSTEFDDENAYGMYLSSFGHDISIYNEAKTYGFNVRCIKG